MPIEHPEDTLKRPGAFAGMLDDCSAIVVLHVSENGTFTFHRAGNVYAQAGAAEVFAKGLRNQLAEVEWDPDEEPSE